MKSVIRSCSLAAFAAAALFAPAVRADYGDLLARFVLDDPDYRVTDPSILAGLPEGAIAVEIPKGTSLPVPIPSTLRNESGHPYTFVMKFKTRIANGWVCLLNMPDSNDSDAMVYLDQSSRKICIKQFDKNSVSAVSDCPVELDRWTVLALSFGDGWTEIFLDGELVFTDNSHVLAGSRADCFSAGNAFLVGADDNGDDNTFYLADLRIYDGAVAVGDELLGHGTKENPYLISSAADWNLFAHNVNLGRASGHDIPAYRLEKDIGTASAPVTNAVGELGSPFCGYFDGNSHTIHVAISGDAPGTALFGRTDSAQIGNLNLAGTVSSTADHAAAMVGICDGLTVVSNCTVSASVSVSGADHAGGVVGNAGSGNAFEIVDTVFSGSVSGPAAHAGGLVGWSGSQETLVLRNCLVKGSYSGSGKWHPVACMEPGSTFAAQSTGTALYYLNTAMPTEDADHVIPGAEGAAVSETLVPGWTMPVTAVDGNVYYRDAIHLTPSTPALRVSDGDVLTGIGGTETVLLVSDGATVTLRNVNLTAMPDDDDHKRPAIVCEGDAVIVLEGTNAVKGGKASYPAIHVLPGKTLVIRGDGSLDARSNGNAAGIGACQTSGGACGNIVIEGGTIVATGGYYAAGIGGSYQGACGNITIAGGNVTATGGQYAAGIGAGCQADCGAIDITGGTVVATGGEYSPGIGSGAGESQCGDISISEGVLAVTAACGENGEYSVGSCREGTCGTVTVAGAETGPIAENPWTYAPGIVEIATLADWEAFAARVNGGVDSYAGETVTLAADLGPVATAIGTQDHPFRGTFEGGGHVLTAALNGTDYFVAPFSAIGGATIRNLAVSGTVSGGMHCSGLVGVVVDGTNLVENCAVSAEISSSGSHFGGFVGHSVTNTVTLRGCAFSGSLSGGTYVATFHAWSDDGATTALLDCFDASGSAQPLGRGNDAACVSNTYYLAAKNFGNRERLWSEPNRGKRAHTVTGGEGVTIDFGVPAAAYGVSGIDAYAPGVVFQGGAFRAGSGDAVPLLLSSVLPAEAYAASAGTLSGSGSAWTLAMPDDAVVVSVKGGHQPQAALDVCEGRTNAVHVNGWAFDPDVSSWSSDVEVRLYTDADCTTQYGEAHVLKTDVLRTDVNRAKGIEGVHGFDADIPGVFAGTYWVKVFALDATGDGSVQIVAARSVTVSGVSLVELTADSADVELGDGDMLTGTGGPNTHVTIADGATVTLRDAAIDATGQSWAGITCLGSATIVLAGTSSVKGSENQSGIYVPSGQTLVIRGDGALAATGGSCGAGIGAGYGSTNSCGDIVIEGGTVIATGGGYAAGIGGGYSASCGDITILGGAVTATGGKYAAGIGCGRKNSSCGDIAIASGVTRLAATAGDGADAIGEGAFSGCSVGAVAIGGTETGALHQRCVVYPVEPGTYTIRFDKNNDFATGTMDDLEVLSNTPQQLPACAFVKDKYHTAFEGWNTAADGSGETIAEGQTLFNYGDATLFAQWPAITYAIAYPGATDGEMGVSNPNPASYTFDSADITLADPVRAGCTFDGWTCEGQDTPTKSVVIPHGSSGDKTFTAHWSIVPIVTLTTDTQDLFLFDGHTLTGTGGKNTHVTIADGATVTLDGVDLTAIRDGNRWAGITCLGSATIVLAGTNSVQGGKKQPGIYVPTKQTLVIRGDGSLSATGGSDGAGIGSACQASCGDIVIEGGTVIATGGAHGAGIGAGSSGSCGDIVIAGGTVTSTGGTVSSGIGGGYLSSCGDISLAGGTVNATGGSGGAGIGSGREGTCGNIVIGSDDVTAMSGSYGAGIGSGWAGSCGDITILGGTVTATGRGNNGAGIGSGYDAFCGNIVFTGGNITAVAGTNSAAIGCGNASSTAHSYCGDITIARTITRVTVTKGKGAQHSIGKGTDDGICGTVTVGGVFGAISESPYTYTPDGNLTSTVHFDANGGSDVMDDWTFTYTGAAQAIPPCTFTAPGGMMFLGWTTAADGGGMYYANGQQVLDISDVTLYALWGLPVESVPDGKLTLHDGQTLTGTGGENTHVTIADGATVTLDGVDITSIFPGSSHQWAGITCEGDATIILRGENAVEGGKNSAGIFVPAGRTLTIRGGGSLTATGYSDAAGIGGGQKERCGNIVIEGGSVTATGCSGGAGIGNGISGTCGNIVIEGGSVTATGGSGGAGIGSGREGTCGNIVLSGGTVTANGGSAAAGIGSGEYASCGNIGLSGGTITATGGPSAAAIGCGYVTSSDPSSCGDITIAGGVVCVTATKTSTSANVNIIGTSGSYSTCGTVTIDPSLIDVLDNGNKTRTLYPGLVLRDDADNAAAVAAADDRTLDVQLDGRTFAKDGSWQTLCLPFDMDAGQVAAQLAPSALRTLRSSSFDGGTLALDFADAAAIEAGKPYIVRWDGGDNLVDPVFTGVSVRAAAAPVETAFADFIGSFSPVEIAAADAAARLVGADGMPVRPAADTVLGACRAWLLLKGEAADGDGDSYALWAAQNGIAGAWDAVDADGIANVFRYLFGKPAGTDGLAILALRFDADGRPVVVTSPLVNTQGFSCAVTAADTPAWKDHVTSHPLDATGETTVDEADTASPTRFYRLTATPAE